MSILIFDSISLIPTWVFTSIMAPLTPKVAVSIDLKSKPWQQKQPLHNRWHPRIPPVAEVKTGELFRVEMVDWTGGAIKDDDSALDVKFLDLSPVSRVLYPFHR